MKKLLLTSTFSAIFLVAVLMITSCKKETPAAPTVTLSETSYTGKTGDEISVDVSTNAPGEFKSLEITKYLGTDKDTGFGSGGTETASSASYTLNYTLNAEGLTTPVRFNFKVTDQDDQTGTADLVITTEPSLEYVLTNFNWLPSSKRGKCLAADPEKEEILDCEKDNVYSFNADGSYTLDYGALTGSGGGTCDFDGLNAPTTWSINDDETVLTLSTVNVFDPNDVKTQTLNIKEFSTTSLKTTETIDLSAFGCIVYDWGIDFVAKPK